ncbi:MAG: hypothetical protein C5B52_09025 [Bacteroidetes bacterium]|nr:MAG: hypothetical protein C5B52_09025 [Bacteroidota bacterium]
MKAKFLFAVLGLGYLVIVLNVHCTKIAATEIGTDLLPAVDNVYTFDTTLEVIANNYISPDSSLPYFSGQSDLAVIGSVPNDPQFGKSSSALFIEMKPNVFPTILENVKDSLYLDSVVLCLSYHHNWGDSNIAHQIGVYQMTQKIRSDSTYKINSPFTYSTLLGSATVLPSTLNDSVILQKERLKNQLRIKLDDSFGRWLLDQDTSGAYKSDSLFKEYFNGFAIVPDAGDAGNSMMYFSLTDANTSLRLYYRYDKNGKRDTTVRNFPYIFGVDGVALNVQRDYSGSQFQNHLAEIPGGDSLIYLQTVPGSYTKINASSINGFKAAKGNVIIHRAEFSAEQVFSPGESDEVLTPPPFLYLDAFDTAAGAFKPFVPDLQFTSSGAPLLGNFGGAAKLTTDASGNTVARYTFVISRYLQGIVTRNQLVYNMRLAAPNTVFYKNQGIPSFLLNNMAEGRVKLGGGNNAGSRMKIHIIYSKI